MKEFGALFMAVAAGATMIAIGSEGIAFPIALCAFTLTYAGLKWLTD